MRFVCIVSETERGDGCLSMGREVRGLGFICMKAWAPPWLGNETCHKLKENAQVDTKRE